MKQKIKVLFSVGLVVTLMLAMGILVFGAYNEHIDCFHNHHIQSGMQDVAYDTFSPKAGICSVDFDCNTVISTGTYYVGMYQRLANGTYGGGCTDVGTITKNASTKENAFTFYLYKGTYKPYMVGYDGIHIIMNKVRYYYNK